MFDVCVLGSLNMDLVINVDKIPAVGETILANGFMKFPGGKGANQAVAAARLGSRVIMLGCVGKDDNGDILLNNLNRDDIDTSFIKRIDSAPTGIALITVDGAGNNTISVYPGANMKVDLDYIDNAKGFIESSKIVVAQFETPIEATKRAFRIAKKFGKKTILNPAPAKKIDEELIKLSDIIVPNETETEIITGILPESEDSIKEAGKILIEKGAEHVIITLGSKGAAIMDRINFDIVPAYKVNAVDTTAAGDSFIGAISYYLSKEQRIDFETLKSAVKFSNKVSAIAVTRKGAQSSLPYLKEVIEVFGEE
ncbi:Ribokinase [Caloramator mitchellensis]|uniref:Ribokinase n=1 Tax=Caloramator mitchellensis TaxID=908809 RepID=A0A0R3JSJ1_CALMK|nr:ribokinase [Caloramator mitchellensis]KRQ86467.1 Ribokinase [Caloramator mitchellensis]